MARLRLFQLPALLTLTLCLAQAVHAQSSDLKITPEMLGLADGNARTAEPYETRVYPADDNCRPIRTSLDRFDKSYPIIVDRQPGQQYKLQEKEAAAFHGALDLSSRPAPGKAATELPFKAGVYGTCLRARGDDGVILVQLPNGNIIHYLHTSEAKVVPGQKITPDTVLGKTGDIGAGAIHLHLQATDPKGKLIDIDKAFMAGRKPDLWTAVDWKAQHWVDFKPDYQTLPKPKVVDGVVYAAGKITYDDDAPKAVDLVGTWTTKKWTTSEIDCTDTLVLKGDKSATWERVSIYAGHRSSGRILYTWSVERDTVTLTKVSDSDVVPGREISFTFKGGKIEEWTKLK